MSQRRWFRLPLWLLPAHVREEHARELDEWEQEERPGTLRNWLALWVDVLRAAPRAHRDVLRQDLVLVGRQLRRAPAFAVVVVLTLGVGIGGNALLFSLVDGILLRPLPYPEPERLVTLMEQHRERGLLNFGISPANFRDHADTARFESRAAWHWASRTALIGDTPERVLTLRVTGDFFRVFSQTAHAGRLLLPEDDVPGSQVAVVSHQFWRTLLAGDADIIGKALILDGMTFRVVGVAAEEFAFPAPTIAAWTPLGLSAEEWNTGGARYLSAGGRLAAGVTVADADAAAQSRSAALAGQFPEYNTGWTATVRSLHDATVGTARQTLLLLWAAGWLVLLIAVANVANLCLGRAIAREREMSLRTALGARTWRLARLVMTEGLVLSLAGGALGLGAAYVLLTGMSGLGVNALPRFADVSLDWRTALFTAGLVIVAALGFGLVPAITSGRRPAWSALQESRGGLSHSRARWQSALVSVEAALAAFVLVSGGLVVRSLAGLLGQPLGLAPENVVTFRTEPPWRVDLSGSLDSLMASFARDRERADAGYAMLASRLEALPGVVKAGGINRLPLTGQYWVTSVDVVGHEAPTAVDRPSPWVRVVTPGYFEAIGTRILRGRGIEPGDRAGSEPVVVIDETFATQVLSGRDPLEAELVFFGPGEIRVRARVVGVTESVHMNQLDADLRPSFYVPLAQAIEGLSGNWGMDMVVRARGGDVPVAAVRGAVREAFPDAAVFQISTMESWVSASVADRRFQLLTLGLFGGTALVLTMVGLGGLLWLVVQQRSRELGVRLALGARPLSLWWLVQRRGVGLTLAGAAAGLASAWALAHLFGSLVYGVSVRDPVAFTAGPLCLVIAAFVASALPALRASLTEPQRALRAE